MMQTLTYMTKIWSSIILAALIIIIIIIIINIIIIIIASGYLPVLTSLFNSPLTTIL